MPAGRWLQWAPVPQGKGRASPWPPGSGWSSFRPPRKSALQHHGKGLDEGTLGPKHALSSLLACRGCIWLCFQMRETPQTSLVALQLPLNQVRRDELSKKCSPFIGHPPVPPAPGCQCSSGRREVMHVGSSSLFLPIPPARTTRDGPLPTLNRDRWPNKCLLVPVAC